MKFLETYYNDQVEGSLWKNKDMPGYTLLFKRNGGTIKRELYATAEAALSALRSRTNLKLYAIHSDAVLEGGLC